MSNPAPLPGMWPCIPVDVGRAREMVQCIRARERETGEISASLQPVLKTCERVVRDHAARIENLGGEFKVSTTDEVGSVIVSTMTTAQAANALGVTTTRVGQLIEEGGLSGSRDHERGRWRVDRHSVLAELHRRRNQ
jgi:excisionase family DNA binding protein